MKDIVLLEKLKSKLHREMKAIKKVDFLFVEGKRESFKNMIIQKGCSFSAVEKESAIMDLKVSEFYSYLLHYNTFWLFAKESTFNPVKFNGAEYYNIGTLAKTVNVSLLELRHLIMLEGSVEKAVLKCEKRYKTSRSISFHFGNHEYESLRSACFLLDLNYFKVRDYIRKGMSPEEAIQIEVNTVLKTQNDGIIAAS